ncbi:putative 3-phenylpropionate permease [Escherichia coli]|nr:putative 3-phenylpropionate permease [Escherichia coli]
MVCVVGAGSPELALSGLRLLLQGAHAAYYGFSAIYWQAAGYSASAVGYLWSLGVVAEVIIFALSNKLFRRCSARDMLLISAICGVVRWALWEQLRRCRG